MRIYIILFMLYPTLVSGQRAKGLIWDQDAYDRTAVISTEGMKNNLESLVDRVDLSPYCPPVGNQGSDPTCTAWAVGYGAMTIELAIALEKAYDKEFLEEEAFSVSFIYNQIKLINTCDQPTYIDSALSLLKKVGNLKLKDFDTADCRRLPDTAEVRKAKLNRIADYSILFSSEADAKEKISAVKQSLIREHPAIIRMDLTENFDYLQGYEFWYPDGDETPEMHAMVVVGFDNGKGNRKGAFKIMNSWGSSWGKDGFCWVHYDDFAEYCWGAYEISLSPDLRQVYNNSGKIKIAQLTLKDRKIEPNFLSPSTSRYAIKTPSHSWQAGDTSQIYVSEVSNEQYLYAFSYDAKREVNVHWPRDGKLDEKYTGRHESSMIASSLMQLTLPTKTSAFQLNELGREQVVLLFSAVPINDINARLNTLRKSKYSFKRGFQEAFGDILLDRKEYDISIEAEQLTYTAKSNVSQGVIPIIYEFNIEKSN